MNSSGADDDEYAIDAGAFRQALLDQRRTQMKGGLYHLNQILMAYNTNRIEGSRLSAEQTRYIYETRTVTDAENVSVDDVMETVNSFELFDTMLDGIDEPITAETMKNYHAILKRGTADARLLRFAVGAWKRVANEVGGRATTNPEHVDLGIHGLLERTPERMSFEDIARFHHDFERIHPFQDGNGRVGRALMFQQCLQNDIMPFVVLDSHKMEYYRGLARFDEEPGFLIETLRFMQDAYYNRFAKFVGAAPSVTAVASLRERFEDLGTSIAGYLATADDTELSVAVQRDGGPEEPVTARGYWSLVVENHGRIMGIAKEETEHGQLLDAEQTYREGIELIESQIETGLQAQRERDKPAPDL